MTNSKLSLDYLARRDTLFVEIREEWFTRADRVQQGLWAEATPVAREVSGPVAALHILIDPHGIRVSVNAWVHIPGRCLLPSIKHPRR